MRVLVLCEDHTHDRHILAPVVQCLIPNARIRFHQKPPRGVDAIIREAPQITLDYRGAVDLAILFVDRDGLTGDGEDRVARIKGAEREAEQLRQSHGAVPLVAIAAQEEIEIFALAAYHKSCSDPGRPSWQALRHEANLKETYYMPFASKKLGESFRANVGMGNKRLMNDLPAGWWNTLTSRCSELKALQKKINPFLK